MFQYSLVFLFTRDFKIMKCILFYCFFQYIAIILSFFLYKAHSTANLEGCLLINGFQPIGDCMLVSWGLQGGSRLPLPSGLSRWGISTSRHQTRRPSPSSRTEALQEKGRKPWPRSPCGCPGDRSPRTGVRGCHHATPDPHDSPPRWRGTCS